MKAQHAVAVALAAAALVVVVGTASAFGTARDPSHGRLLRGGR
jgi:ABC-type spermidine/putrescine transport system permease subunit II